MARQDLTLELSATFTARLVPVLAGAGGGNDIDEVELDTITIGSRTMTRKELVELLGAPGAAALTLLLEHHLDDGEWEGQ